MPTLHELLFEARTRKGLTHREVAEHMGFSISYSSNIEKEATRPSIATLQGLAELYDLDVDEVMVAAGRISPEIVSVLSSDLATIRKVRKLVERAHA